MHRPLLLIALLIAAPPFLHADLEWEYGWEDGLATALGAEEDAHGAGITYENSGEAAYRGTRSLKITEEPRGGTPQVFIWWVRNMRDGDRLTANFRVHDLVPGGVTGLPSGRIWGHYTDNVDISNNLQCAGGNLNYSRGPGWSLMEKTWTFNSDGGRRSGMVVQARIYSGTSGSGTNVNGNVIFIDNTWIQVEDNGNAVITRADGATLPEPVVGLGALLSLAVLCRR